MPVNSFDNYPMAWKPEKAKLSRPIYKSLADQMEKDIKDGLLLPGTKLPPQRELADFLDINFTTVTRAYKLCEYKGLIQSVMGSGTFVSIHAVSSKPLTVDNISDDYIEMAPVTSFEETNHMILPIMQKILNHKYTEQFLDYRNQIGMAHQRKAGSQWINMTGLNVNQNDIAIMTGSLNAIGAAFLALFKHGDRIAVDTFTYTNFIELSKLFHLTLVPVSGDCQGMSAQALDASCRKMHITGLFLMPSCSNPTTNYISASRKKELAQVIKRHDLILIEDDSDGFMTYGFIEDCDKPMYDLVPDNTVYICSMSKPLCGGLRIAFIVPPRNTMSSFERIIYNTNIKTSSLDAEIVSQGITDGTAKSIVDTRIELSRKMNAVYDEFFPDKTAGRHPFPYYRWLRLPEGTDPQETADRLLKRGVHVYSSNRFCSDSKATGSYLRISLSSAGSETLLRKGLEIIQSEVGD